MLGRFGRRLYRYRRVAANSSALGGSHGALHRDGLGTDWLRSCVSGLARHVCPGFPRIPDGSARLSRDGVEQRSRVGGERAIAGMCCTDQH